MTPPGLALLERAFGRGGIVGYHGIREGTLLPSAHITPEGIRRQFEFLAETYVVLPLTEFVARRKSGRSVRNCVAITFDDAYSGILTHVLPLLERMHLPATVFVASGFCSRGERFWWDRIEWVAERLDAEGRAELFRNSGLASDAVDHEVRDTILTRHRGALPPAFDRSLRRAEQVTGLVPERAMSPDELLQLSRSELVDFGCHTAHHYALPWLTPAKAEKEIRLNHAWMRERLPRVRPYLAYPYGLFTRDTIEAARRAGMEVGFSLAGRAATTRFAMFDCPRVGLADVNTLKGLRLRLTWAMIPVVTFRDRGWISKRTP
jgi:peptidoglycan/xylan/chitin deacetylase (PgdA/CDA1 family)